MKTATVTWITYNNYGTELQAYALQQFVKSLGYANSILSDREILRRHRALLAAENRQQTPPAPVHADNPPARSRRGLIDYVKWPVRRFRNARRERALRPYADSQARFEAFKEQALDIDGDVDPDRLPELDERYDCFLCGSDQIWSPLRINFNEYYYLSFSRRPKIAYAPSFGTERLPEEKRDAIRELLRDFSGLSVREEMNQAPLEELTGMPVSFVCDPTLLLDGEAWSGFCSAAKRPRGSYLACYFLESREWYFAYARALAKQLGLRPVLIPSRKEHTERKACCSFPVGPAEFAAMLQGAEFVLTDSYHGSIFSMLFSKPFLCFKRFDDDAPNNQNSRVVSLFAMLGLERHFIPEKSFEASDLQPIDYPAVQRKLSAFREASECYLRDRLSECEARCAAEKNEE